MVPAGVAGGACGDRGEFAVIRGLILISAALMLSACDDRPAVGGQYDVIARVQPGSVEQVRMEVVIDFRCGHCLAFQSDVDALRAKYGRALLITRHPVPRPDVDYAVRLYGAVAGSSVEQDVVAALYEAGVNQRPLASQSDVRSAMRGVEIPDAMWQLATGAEVQARIEADHALAKAVGFLTPTLVFEGQLKALPHRENAEAVIDSLLQDSR